MRSLTVKQTQRLDYLAITRLGIPSIVLMESAGRSVAQETIRQLKRKHQPKVCVVCGVGNNAGDGFAAARHLLNHKIKVKVVLIGRGKDLKKDAAVNYQILKRMDYRVAEVEACRAESLRSIAQADAVIDAIFGVGLNRNIEDPFKGFIEKINKNAKRIIAVDIPSGLDGTTGNIYGVCIKAHTTVTFSYAKKGFYKNQGPRHVGKVLVTDIGIPKRVGKGS